MKKTITIFKLLLCTVIFFISSTFVFAQDTPGILADGHTGMLWKIAGGLQQVYSSTGHYTLSADGIGSAASSMNVRVNKPTATATVQYALLISTITGSAVGNGCVSLAGTSLNWDGSASTPYPFNNQWVDVTSIVAAQVNSLGAGQTTLAITECNSGAIDGEALLVVFNDVTATEKTIIIMCGAMNSAGDDFSVTLAEPIDPAAPSALLDMGIGIGFSYQNGGGGQVSQVSVNGTRITSSAGGEDDGASANGALITVGGIGDSHDNPANPFAGTTNPRSDDELYNILPFITNTTTNLTLTSYNPSGDDNIFLAYFALSGAAIIGEGILASQTSTTGLVGTTHQVKAKVLNSLGEAVVGRSVTFTITSGPNSGGTHTENTDAIGEAFYTYTGSGGAGTDNIQAQFTNNSSTVIFSNTLSFEWTSPPSCTAPSIGSQSTGAQTQCLNGTFTAITVTATGDGLIYHWYSNLNATTSGGTAIGTNSNSYTPLATTAGTLYYYCVVTGTCGTATSAVSGAFIVNAPPTLTPNTTNVTCEGGNNGAIVLGVSGGTSPFNYVWATNSIICGTSSDCSSMMGAGAYCQAGQCHGVNQNLSNLMAGTYTVTITDANLCTATASVLLTATPAPLCQNGGTVTIDCGCLCPTGYAGALCQTLVCTAPSISSQSTAAQTQCINGTFSSISVSASGTGLSYQWYSNINATTSGGTAVGTNSNSYTPSTAVAGTLYYYCVVTGTCGTATSAVSGAFIVNPNPTPVITGPNVVTHGGTYTYCTPLTSGNVYYWSGFGVVTPNANHNCIDDTFSSPCGAYTPWTITVIETVPNTGCTATATKNITIN